MNLKHEWAICLAPIVDMPIEEIEGLLEVPPQMEMGDLAFPVFRLAKVKRKAPPMIAKDIVTELSNITLPEWVGNIEAAGPYVNVSFSRMAYVGQVVDWVLNQGEDFGRSDEGNLSDTAGPVLIEYSSPNIAKPFHVGHAFSTIVGNALYRIHDHLGYETVRINYLGDYGTQFGKLIVAYDLWCDHNELESDPIKELTRIYVKFHHEVENNPELETQAREAFKRLEEGGEKERELWQRFRDLSLESFNRVYERLGVGFDDYNGESFYSDKTPRVISELKEKNLLVTSEGAQVVDLEADGMPPVLILKSDGTTIYASRDIASILYRHDHYGFSKNIYVVGLPQSLHFKQVFKVVEKMDYPFAKDCIHVPFGTVKFPEGKMSTRGGDVILLNDLLEEAVSKTKAIIRKNNEARIDPMSEIEVAQAAETVGLGAVIHAFVRQSRERDIVFTWEDMLDFEGDTAPYLQYTYARGRSILRRFDQSSSAVPEDHQDTQIDPEIETVTFVLAKAIADLPDAILAARRAYEPSIITRQVSVIARAFNSFYHKVPILKADANERAARLRLTEAACLAIKTGLSLVGIGVTERM